MVFTKLWWKAAAIRAIKTMCQTAIAIIPAAVTITAVDWLTVAGTAALAGAMSILTSLAGLPEVGVPEARRTSEPDTNEMDGAEDELTKDEASCRVCVLSDPVAPDHVLSDAEKADPIAYFANGVPIYDAEMLLDGVELVGVNEDGYPVYATIKGGDAK